uniref:Prolyl endopeptidase n=1 Tax=Ditylenchus dipsaci TaxID=166011 RepID=A0A915CWC7_9BILA
MFIVHNKDVTLDGEIRPCSRVMENLTIPKLRISLSQMLCSCKISTDLCGGHLRGGGEYGEKWHEPECVKKSRCWQLLVDLMVAYWWQRVLSSDLIYMVLFLIVLVFLICFASLVHYLCCVDIRVWRSDDANDFPFLYKYSPLHNISLTKKYSGLPLVSPFILHYLCTDVV